MNNVICDYCDELIEEEPYAVHEDSGCIYCSDPCYDAAMEGVRAADEHDLYYGFLLTE